MILYNNAFDVCSKCDLCTAYVPVLEIAACPLARQS